MICIVQRVNRGSVTVEGSTIGQIGAGLVVLAAIEKEDAAEQIQWMAEKLTSLRIFRNGDKHFDQDIKQVGGSILLISNFTVAAATKKGRRPSFDGAADPISAAPIFDQFVAAVREQGVAVETGQFGASMLVSLENDGPSTFIVRTGD